MHTYNSLDEQLRQHARTAPERVCVRTIDSSVALTYRMFDRAVTRFVEALHADGVAAGSRVALGFGNTPEFLIAILGCLRAGVVAAPLDPTLAQRELRGAFGLLEPSLLIVDASTPATLRAVSAECGCPTQSISAMLTQPPTAQASLQPVDPAAPGLILCTSGTTGAAKGVVLARNGLDAKLHAITQSLGIDASFTSLCILPTHFGHGLIANCLTTIYAGGTLVLGPAFNLDVLQDLWRTLAHHKISNFSTVPTMIRLLLALGEGSSQLPALKFVTCASAPLLPDEILAFEDSCGVPLLNCYGLTETSSWSTCSRVEGRDLRSVGWPVGCEVRAVDASGRACAPGQRGELQIAGPSILTEYFRADSQSASALDNNWFRTGDLGEVDASGQVFVHARLKDMIIRAGKNVFPSEIDAVLLGHPAVSEACSFGLPDPLLGEKVAACVVVSGETALGEAELHAYARSQLADYKCPEQILIVDAIPKTTRGKVRRSDVRTMFEEAQR